MAKSKTVVTPVCKQWSYFSFALSDLYSNQQTQLYVIGCVTSYVLLKITILLREPCIMRNTLVRHSVKQTRKDTLQDTYCNQSFLD